MAEKELKWYSIFVPLFGAVLSIADPITDVLTLVEFYRTDHKTWFGVGLTFLILPSFIFLIFNCTHEFTGEDQQSEQEECQCTAWECTHASFLGCNPLYPAWLKLRLLFFYLKMLLKHRQGSNTDQTSEDLEEHLLGYSKLAVLAEAALEAAPQFIIQLYAMAVQQQSVSIIQMVSLPVSFLSIAWASTVTDEFIHCDEGDLNFSVKDRVLLFVTYLFTVSSRLFAVALFTVSYKWWVTSVLIFHCALKVICDIVWLRRKRRLTSDNLYVSVLFSSMHWLRDDVSTTIRDEEIEQNRIIKHVRRMQLVSNVLFVIENITLILLFYFSHVPHTWYSLPVTICVCLFAVLGAVMRLTHFYFLTTESDGPSSNTDQVQQQSHSNHIELAAT